MSQDNPETDEPTTPEEEDREAILARRARFVATALVGLTGIAGCDPRPQPCLNIAPVATTSPTDQATAMPCLSQPMPTEDAGTPQPCLEVAAPPATSPPPKPSSSALSPPGDPPADAGTKPTPSPCLSMPWPSSRPQPCLSPPPPKPPSDGKK